MDKIRSATSGLTTLAKTIANPHDHPPQRLPSFPNLERTAVSPFMTTGTYSLAGGGTRRALLCRSPAFPLWAEQIPQPATALSQSLQVWNNNQSIELPSAAGVAWTFGKLVADLGSYNESGWSPAYSQKYNWPNAIDATGQFWFFTPSACNSEFEFLLSAVGTASFELDVEVISSTSNSGFTGTMATMSGSVSAAVQVAIGSANVTGWWRPVELRITSTGGAGLSIIGNSMKGGWNTGGTFNSPTGNWGTVSLWPLAAAPEFATSTVPYSATRSTASSVLFTNVTKVVAKEGTVMAARFNSAVVPFLGFTASNMATTHPKEKYFSGLEHGFYAFTLPDENSARFADCVTDGLSTSYLPLFNFAHIGYFTAIVFNDLDATDSTTLAWTGNSHLEYRSSSTLFPLGFSTTSLESYHVAQMSLASMGTMFENPLHLGAITALASAAVRKFAPIVAPHLMTMARAGGNYLLNAAASKLVSNFKQSGVAPANTKAPPAPKKKIPAKSKPKARPARKKK